ncbi:MAG: cupin domain-containing protein [Spirochaetales bacterium]|nr:cupin domain-containing protein [Spirochaetales bacterium]
MVKTLEQMEIDIRDKMRGGNGQIKITHVFKQDELHGKARLFASMTLEPGSSVGYHVHENEEEIYYIISGEAEVDDNGEIRRLSSGDALLTSSGKGHSIKNSGEKPLEILAVILLYN